MFGARSNQLRIDGLLVGANVKTLVEILSLHFLRKSGKELVCECVFSGLEFNCWSILRGGTMNLQ